MTLAAQMSYVELLTAEVFSYWEHESMHEQVLSHVWQSCAGLVIPEEACGLGRGLSQRSVMGS